MHCCCAPCSVSCISSLITEGLKPNLFWFNPNIHPYSEYKQRYDCFVSFVEKENLDVTSLNVYDLGLFIKEVYTETENRCERCYRLRLEKTASAAVNAGLNAFSTTLLISPYQDHKKIKHIGEETAKKYCLEFLYRDFRPLFRSGQSAARENKMYMQKYCGCIFSEEERYKKTGSFDL